MEANEKLNVKLKDQTLKEYGNNSLDSSGIEFKNHNLDSSGIRRDFSTFKTETSEIEKGIKGKKSKFSWIKKKK